MLSRRWRAFPIAELHARTTAWNTLVSANGYPPFLLTDFVLPALQEFGTGRELLAVCGTESEPSAMAIVSSKRPGIWETFQPSQLPLGAFLRRGTEVLPDVLDTLLPALSGVAGVVAITQQDPAIVARPEDTAYLRTLDYIETARILVDGEFDRYWSSLGKNLRHNVKRQRAKLEVDGVVARLDIIDEAEGVPAAIADYGRLESAGWKAAGGTAVAPANEQGRFYTRVFQSFCAAGKARIYRYIVDGKIAAMDLCIDDAGVVVVLKTAYDETFKTISPATLMRHEYIRQLFDARSTRRIEFYGKVMEWHRRWTDDVRTLYHVNCYRAPWIRRAHEWIRRGAAAASAAGA